MSDKNTIDSKLNIDSEVGKVNIVLERKMFINRMADSFFWRRCVWLVLFVLLFSIASSFCAEANSSAPVRVRIFNLRYIEQVEAKKFLSDVKIGDSVFSIPGTSAISVTGKPEALIFASTLLRMVDSEIVYSLDVSESSLDSVKVLPEQLEAVLGREYSVGSLTSGPARKLAKKVVVDYVNGKQVVIAPAETLVKILDEVKKLKGPAPAVALEPKAIVAIDGNDGGNPYIQNVQDVNSLEPEVVGAVGDLDDFLDELDSAIEAVIVEDDDSVELVSLEVEPIVEESSEVEQSLDEMIAAKVKAILEKMNLGQVGPAEVEVAGDEQGNVVEEDVIEVNSPGEIELRPTAIVMDIPNGDETIDLDLPEKLGIVTLIELVGKYLDLDYLYDEAKIKGDVKIKIQGRLTIRELYDLLENVLKFKGLVMSRKGDLVIIAPAAEILAQDSSFVDGDVRPGDVIVTNVFKLNHIGADSAKNLLASMKVATNVTSIPETGTLVITDYAFRMGRIEELLGLVDVPGPPKEFKLRVLKYTLAEALVPKVQALAEQLGTIDITVGTPVVATPAKPARGRKKTPTPATKAAKSESQTSVFIDFDKRTNRVMMIGMAEEIAAVDSIIDSLDVPQQDLRVIQEYELQYIDTVTVVDSLKNFGIIEGSSSDQSSSSRTQGGSNRRTAAKPAAGATQVNSSGGSGNAVTLDQPQVVELETTNSLLVNATPEQHLQIVRVISYVDREPLEEAIPFRIYRLENQEPGDMAEVINNLIEKTIKDEKGKVQSKVTREEDIAVVPDEKTFSLIVYASKRNQEWIANLIESLDKRRPQVLIDVSLVEVQKNDDFEYDLSIVANASKLATENIAVQGSQLISTAVGQVIEGGYNLTNSDGANTNSVKGFYNEGRMQLLMKLLDSKGYGRVLAQPKILVNDNELGKIETSEKTYIKNETTTYPDQGDPIVTTKWEEYPAKISLEITPQISEGALLRLEIKMIREDFVEGEVGAPPNYAISNVDTVVTVPDGSTIILGGLTKLNQTKSGSKVPGLGDIPLVGGLFRSVDNSDEARRLYIFVKANILRPDYDEGLDQLKDISRKNREAFEKYEDEFQKHESFPGMKPTPIEPLNVLDDIRGEEDVEDRNTKF